MTTCKTKSPTEINFIYLGNNEMYCICKACCIISLYFPQNGIPQFYPVVTTTTKTKTTTTKTTT
jgi:hypothetical protein